MKSDKAVAHVSRRLSASPERVFDSWLDPEAIRAWMGRALRDFGLPGDVRRVEVDARVGGRFTFADMRADGEAVHWGTYRVIDRPRRLEFTWFTSQEEEQENDSAVTLTMEPDGAGTVATITHEMDGRWASHVERTEMGWRTMLEQIGILLGGNTAQQAQ